MILQDDLIKAYEKRHQINAQLQHFVELVESGYQGVGSIGELHIALQQVDAEIEELQDSLAWIDEKDTVRRKKPIWVWLPIVGSLTAMGLWWVRR